MKKKLFAGLGALVLATEAVWLGSLIVRAEVKLRELSLLSEQAEDDAGQITHLFTKLSSTYGRSR